MGNVTIGNPDFFLSKVFEFVRNSEVAQKYLFLNTIRAIIIADSKCLVAFMMDLTDLLMTNAVNESE